ncbi:ATP-dependent DNA helicase [Phocaeicola massiliensis]|jgi:exodeoxyribonuclease-5|uniref:ATP-dependent DNA helicase n=1 Tax=Phocaeicola massiliensis TaxID=204516 RepID=UPI0022E1344E|nr:AAA family ATPase [Phocaeicola massiliensis]
MINNYLVQQIKGNFLYKPTLEQEKAVKSLADFLFSRQQDSVFLLKGYAGTGKTSLIGALVKTLDQLQQKCVLLAPTGRAAKVFSHYAKHSAFTIHKKIYRQRNYSNDMDNFSLDDNLHQQTLFIVDEASMIANDGLSGAAFGTGRLLDDLIQYVYAGTGCRLMLIGDTAQLPPVGEEQSPALSPDVLKGYGLEVYEAQLTEVVRQMHDSGILWNATELRRYISEEVFFALPSIRVDGFPDIRIIPGNELIEAINDSYDHAGMDETIVVCRSNKRANIYNRGIRNMILYREDELNSGDLLMVAKNNYFWTEQCKEIDFIANGDIAVVRRVRRVREAYGFRFADVVLAFPDYGDVELEVKLLLDTLHTDTPALPKEQNDRLFYAVLEDYADITVKRERIKKMKADPHYNALQVKYAYAVTCHKAQGGQWKRVFLDQGYMTEDMLTPDYFRWLYTAFTRATETLYLVNWPKEQME